jgi:hypothetical protein
MKRTSDALERSLVWRRMVAAIAPAVVPAAMTVIFGRLRDRCGDRRGYQAVMAS